MTRLARLTLVVVALLAAGCSQPGAPLDPDLDELEPGGQPVAISRLEQQHPIYHSGIGQAARIVVADRGEWERVWARMWHNHHPVPPVPAVDFGRELVIVAAMGARHTGGYSIRVDEARSYGDHVTIHAVETSPGRGCVTTQAFTAPVDVVKIPRTAAEIRFRTSPVVRECD